MKPLQYHQSSILKEICERVSDISKNVYPENRPTVLSEYISDMVVVSFPTKIEDRHVYQTSDIRFEIMAKDRKNGIPDLEKLERMTNSLTAMFPMVAPRYVAQDPYLALKGQDHTGFTIWVLQADIIINTTDRYDLK